MALKIKNYTTKQQARTSLERISWMLAQAGARDIMTSYDEHQRCTGIRFALETEMGRQHFEVPCDLKRLAAKLKQQWQQNVIRKRIDLDLDQVERIALKCALDWLHVTVSLWTTGLYTPAEAMFGWMLNPSDGRRLFEIAHEKMLPAPQEDGGQK